MISYHPDSRFLTDFAAGDLSLSLAICVSAHLEFCSRCRQRVAQIEVLGAHLLSALQPEASEEGGFERLMARIDEQEPDVAQPSQDAPLANDKAVHAQPWPRALGAWADERQEQLQWVALGRGLRVAPLPSTVDTRETALYDIRAGACMPAHDHDGEEVSVLLKGSYSDADGKYTRGDFIVRNRGETHQPTVTQDCDCLCLVSLERPVRPARLLYRLAGPLVQYRLNRARQQVECKLLR